MANDRRRSLRVKGDEKNNSKKKTVKADASPASSSRRSSRETSSRKQAKESPAKENLSGVRKSVRLEKTKPSGTTPAKERLKKTREQLKATPMRRDDRHKKVVEEPTSSILESKKGKVVKSLKQCLIDTTKDKGHEKQGLDFGGRKRKRAADCIVSPSCKPRQIKTKAGDVDDDDESQSQANYSSNRDVDTELEKTDELCQLNDSKNNDSGSKSVEDKDDRGDECGIRRREESTPNSSKRCCRSSYIKEPLNDTSNTDLCDTSSFKDRTTSEVAEIVENNNDVKNIKSSEECTGPCKLLKKRSVLFLKPLYKCQKNTGKVFDCHFEWLVQWLGLNDEQATWESENSSVLDSPEGQNLIQEYEKFHGNTKISASSDDKIEEVWVKLPTIPAGCPPGMDNIHLNYVKNLHDAWNKGQNSIVFDDQDRIIRIVLFIFSLKDVTHPFLLITTSDSVSQWEAMFLKIAPCNAFKISLEDTDEKRSSRLLHVQKEGGQLKFQVLLYPVDVFVKDVNVLKSIKWEAVIVDESQSSDISSHFSYIKSLSNDKRLLVFCGPLGVSMTSYLDVLSLLDCDVISKTELHDVSKLKEALSNVIAYECKCSSSRFVEYWVPVQISNVQLEQYCSILLSNAMALSSCSKSDTVGALHDILVTNRKCCDHPYIVDPSLQDSLTKDLGLSEVTDVGIKGRKILDVGIKASGKLQFLDLILPEMRKRQLRVLILFQPLSGSGKDSASIGDILDDFIRQRFGQDSYERVDGIGIIASKKQAALNNFNNKDMGRFIFLLEYRACLPSIKLSSIDTIIIFDSDWNPANDLRALHKIAIDSQSEQVMIFRLYTSLTLEEKILRLAEHNVTIDSKLQNISRSTSDALLLWDATYLFNKLDEFHSASVVDTSSKECWLNKLMEDFLNLISPNSKNKDASKLIIARVQPICGAYGKNLPLPSQPDGELPHAFWRKLLVGRDPCWKYISRSTPRQRRRIQYFEESPKKLCVGNDDAGRKRKKTAINIIESVAPKPVIEEGNSGVLPQDGPKFPPGDGICNEMSFGDHLKLKISKLCEVLRVSEDVKILVERFLKYVIENYRVNKEPASTLEAFLISLCWIGSAMLKHKLDRSQSVALANEHLNFSCKEEEANSVYLKLEPAKEMFLSHTASQTKTDYSRESISVSQVTYTESLDPSVKLENPESPHNQDYDDATVHMEHRRLGNSKQISTECRRQKEILDDHNQKDPECGVINLDTSDALKDQNGTNNSNSSNSPCAAVLKEKVPSVPPLVSPASGQRVALDLEIHEESIQDNVVQGNLCVLPEISNLRTLEEHPHVSADTQKQPDSHSADRVDSRPSYEPHNPSQNPDAPPQILETSAQVPDRAVTPSGSNLSNGQGSGNYNRGASRRSYSNPLQAELEKLHELKDAVVKCHEAIKVKLQSDYDKELAEVISQMNHKYEAKIQDADAAFQLKKKEVDICFNRVIMNKVLADIYRSKCQDMTPFKPAEIQMIQSGGIQHPSESHVQPSLRRPVGVTSYSSAQTSGSQQVTGPQRPLQIVHRSTQLFSSTPTRPPSTTNPSTMPPSNTTPSSMPTRPPSSAFRTSTPSKPLSTTSPTSIPSRPPSTSIPTSSQIRPPSTTIPTITPSRTPSTAIPTSSQIRPPSTTIPTSTPSRTPSTAIPTSTPSRPPPSTAFPTSTPSRPPSTAIPTSTPSRPPSTAIPTSTPSRPPSTAIPTSTPSRPPSTAIPTSTPSRPPSTTIPTSTPSRPLSINVATNTLSRPPPDMNSITPSSRPTSNLIDTTPSNRSLRTTSEIRAPAPHIQPFTSTFISHDFASQRVMSSQQLSSSLPMSQSSAQTPLQTPPSFTTNLHSHPTESLARSLPLTSSQPPSSVAVPPPASFQLQTLYSWQPPGSLSTTSSSHFHTSLPPMPSVSISHTGLYNAPADILNQPALDLLMDMDRQVGLHQSNTFPSPTNFLDPTDFSKEGGGNNLLCLSDDD